MIFEYKEIPSKEKDVLRRKFNNMKKRCYDKNDKCYYLYGGKGIEIYQEWLDNPQLFSIWAMNNGYKLGLTIERKDNNKDYCPSNCSFIPNSQQPLNTSRNRFIKYKGEILHLSEVARRENVSPEAIRKRIKFGWYEEVPNPNIG